MTLPKRMRPVTAVLGPTNTGKTHLAIERMLGHESGIIALPLRLLAREVYDKIAARVGEAAVALITGEEKIKPASPRFFVCTVEAMPLDAEVAFVAIDEVQLAADGERGHVFTDRLLHARGEHETLMLGASTMREAIRELLPSANIVSRPRLSKLSYAGQKKITRLPRRSAIVGFSANDVYAIAELVRRQRGGAAVVLGALSPRTRNAQVDLYQSGEVDFLVATDAIGMGLNLNVDHVAFAGVRKFDGQSHRDLSPAELGQIAGRAGRHLNDGTFGVTAAVQPFEPEIIERLENHEFEAVRALHWRNRTLDFGSIDRLKDSLKEAPREPRLARVRAVDDVVALETASADADVRALAVSPAAVQALWDMCQIPDYRKVSPASHAELIATLYRFVMGDSGRVPEDWFGKQVALADRTDGDIDTLANRIAHIRTWTFVSHRADWLDDPGHWQAKTRDIEDRLSDALHEKLMHRFVDRRTSVLMRRLRDREELYSEVGDDGAIAVENHFVGRLIGFRFAADTSAAGVEGRAARNAAQQVLVRELRDRAEQLVAAPDGAFELSPSGDMKWAGAAVARLERGETLLRPQLRLLADETLAGPDRDRVQKRLDTWLADLIRARLAPLVGLAETDTLTGLARGIAFRLTENGGILARTALAEDLKSLDQAARAALRSHGVRFGAFNIHFPALLKPAPASLMLQLWALAHGRSQGLDPDAFPAPPRHGLTSVERDPALPEAFYRAAGYHVAGARVVRIDMLERLADCVRPLIAWRNTAAAEGPKGSTGDGGFRITPDMMALVGCSGENLASILTALGFRRELRPKPPQPEADATLPEPEDAPEAAAEPAPKPAGEAMEEIWRPVRQRPPGAAPRGPKHAAPPIKDGKPGRGAPQHAKRKRVPPPPPPPPPSHSPFAALAALRHQLHAKGPKRP